MTRRILAMLMALVMVFALAACGSENTEATPTPAATDGATEPSAAATDGTGGAGIDVSSIDGISDGVLTVGMECAYAPYNWTQVDDANGAVPIANQPGSYANGYDIMIAKAICEAYGLELEVMALDWGGLAPAIDAGTIDVAIAGQSMTPERLAEVDMAGPYYYADIVVVTKADSEFASAQGISELSGGTCTAQESTIWYSTCLPQIEGAQIQSASESAPAMIMAVESGTVDFICTDTPTARGAVATYDDLVILDFTDSEDNFEVSEGDINIGISLAKGNTALLDAINAVLDDYTEDDFISMMDEAIAIRPEV